MSSPFDPLKKYRPANEGTNQPAPIKHIHNDHCWQDDFDCAKWRVQRQEIEIGALKMVIAQAQTRLRVEIGGILDKIDQVFIDALK